jgi:hypothetical protein
VPRRSLVTAVICAVCSGGGLASSGATAEAATSRIVRLSNERTVTRIAYPTKHGVVYRRPTSRSKRVSVLHYLTEDGLPENYLLLAKMTDRIGRVWVRIRLPQRPNGLTGWVLRSSFGNFHKVTTRLVVDRRKLTITLFREGRQIFRAPIGVGKPSTPTPAGRFWIREHFRVVGVPAYGPYAIGTSAHAPTLTEWPNGGVVGIHGTDEPGLIPGRPSHGCMRMRNADISRLYRLLPIGTPLRIL